MSPHRKLTDHIVNGLNEALEILVCDQPGPGGANHKYQIIGFYDAEHQEAYLRRCADQTGDGPPLPNQSVIDRALDSLTTPFADVILSFQNGPISKPTDFNGITNEALLAVLIDRMRRFPYATNPDAVRTAAPGQYACRVNAIALTHLEEALMWLQKRTRDRMARGVEGTMKK